MFFYSKDKDYIQIVTNSDNVKELEAIGFVGTASMVKKPRKSPSKKPVIKADDQ